MTAPAIRVMIVDDHAVVREGLAAVIGMQPDLAVVASVASGREALERYEPERPDVVILDLRMPELDGVGTLRLLLERHPRARVLMLSSQEGDEAIYRALKQGAVGYVFKSLPAAELLAAIRRASTGRVPLAGEVASRLGDRVAQEPLSEREIEVLRLVARGQGNKEIADALGISASTVKNHLNNIMLKLDAGDRTHAVTIALQRGIIEL